MGYLSERVSYLRGLADGLNISDDTAEGKLLKVIIDVLDDVAISVEEVEDEQKALADDIADIDERLEDAEDFIYDDCDCDCDDDEDCCCCDCDDDEDIDHAQNQQALALGTVLPSDHIPILIGQRTHDPAIYHRHPAEPGMVDSPALGQGIQCQGAEYIAHDAQKSHGDTGQQSRNGTGNALAHYIGILI